ncbi:rab GTPase-binding effector protein 2 isoform X2 [Corythoichthys intestinalis]|uniref:rab GTPase-binding effector protein 2 isoform X2 n=1 Tax=Corythoichthys intestinalis TaxID=161448 RepID=UPI0025A5E70A|nr:rab GTPase-binding effector protein 2 isoform X2 [Corythoichthys intestinalis]
MEVSGERRMSSKTEDKEAIFQAQLAECQAQVEHWQGVATICELSKREELVELQKQCDQEIQSLQEALRETAAQYESRIASLLEGRRASIQKQGSGKKDKVDAEVSCKNSQTSPDNLDCQHSEPELAPEGESPPTNTEGYFSLRNCDSASLSSFSIDTPSLPRKLNAQEDTDSLVSTGTLVPEAIYLPPAGHRLVTHSDWDALNAQVSDLREEVSRLTEVKEELERELDTQTNHTHKQVSVLQSQVQSSEALLQELQKSLSQSQTAVQGRLSELSLSQRKVCSELSRLKGETVEDEVIGSTSSLPPLLQAAHCEERLRIEIVNLREQLDIRAEENEVLEVQFSSLKTETDRIQAQKDQFQADLMACRTELEAMRVALSHVQGNNKMLNSDNEALHQQCLELRSQVISLRSQVDTSQTVQRDFVQLSQSLQVKLELIRQAESFEQIREILDEGISEADSSLADSF